MELISEFASADLGIAGLLGLHNISKDCTLLASDKKMPILILVTALSQRQAEWVPLQWLALLLLCNLSVALLLMHCAIHARCMISRYPVIRYLAYPRSIFRVYLLESISDRYAD